ncbi:hypothetical protein HWV03_13080 [Moritella sp. 36]|uniref:two-partner secretion domain-containing protein n=1 Tax=Moritella sp. 36 TaxID=2746233 RepID=UPI001BAD88D2|nr:hypothetical protein [Moritella sp. 36]QUM89667.1 hypothetical protein HWV03_13080 [Moritella sp. 36]
MKSIVYENKCTVQKKVIANIIYGILYCISLLFITPTWANKVELFESNKTPVFRTGNDFDTLDIVPADKNGISYNVFKKFKQDGNPINIINNPALNPLLKNTIQAPTVIVLYVKNTSIELGQLNIIGKGAELIIVSDTDITCLSCDFNNISRLVLTTGTPVFNNDRLTSFNVTQGTINIDSGNDVSGLMTNGASVIDLIANKINVNAEINTQLFGRKTAQGKIKVDNNGPLSVAVGELQLISGHNIFDLSSGAIAVQTDSTSNVDSTINVSAPIYAGDLNLESTALHAKLTINAPLSTIADLTLASTYKTTTVLPLDSITLKAFGPIIITDQLKSGNKVNLESTNTISIIQPLGFNQKSIETGSLNIAAVGLFSNYGVLQSKDLYIAAGRINNENALWGTDEVYLAVQTDIDNRFGGMIIGEKIALNAKGKVNNGSLKPYRLIPGNRNGQTFGDLIIGTAPNLPDDPNGMVRERIDTLAATILGSEIVIQASKFSNLNPYVVTRASYGNKPAELDTVKNNQVIISAETSMTIKAKEEIFNSSGIIEVLAGSLTVDAPLMKQERYHVRTSTHTGMKNVRIDHCDNPKSAHYKYARTEGKATSPQQCKNYWDNYRPCNMLPIMCPGFSIYNYFKPDGDKLSKTRFERVNAEVTTPYVQILSPLARTRINGNLMLNAKRLENESSAIEVIGNVQGKSGHINMVGYKLDRFATLTTITHHSKRYCSRRAIVCLKRKTRRWTTSSTELVKQETMLKFPFIFFVDGKVEAGFGTQSQNYDDITFGPNS